MKSLKSFVLAVFNIGKVSSTHASADATSIYVAVIRHTDIWPYLSNRRSFKLDRDLHQHFHLSGIGTITQINWARAGLGSDSIELNGIGSGFAAKQSNTMLENNRKKIINMSKLTLAKSASSECNISAA